MKHLLPVVVLLLAGCAAPMPPVPPDVAAAWQARQQALQSLQYWQLAGRVAVIREPEAWHLKVRWQHTPAGYEILLAGPFGSGRVKLTGYDGRVVLQDAEHRRYTARDPESLLYEQTGVYMPVNGLRYWIRGLPDPQKNRVSATKFDAWGRLAELRQGDWLIRYEEYVTVEGMTLPRLLEISRGDLEVRVVVDRWQIEPGVRN
ncbi:MAG: lipoprotein insertase outer membrane protein LolB [Alphaproteobacteria bacterium]